MKKDIFYLAIIQILRFVVPLITFPYLTKTLGVKSFGLLAYCSGIIAYFALIVEYGFNKIATAKIAKIKHDKELLSKYSWAVFTCQILLFFICIILFILLTWIFNVDVQEKNIILILSLAVLGSVFTPSWFFLGMGKMKEQVPIVLTGRLLTIPLIIIFVKNENDIEIAAFLQSSAFLVSAIISCIYIKISKVINKITFDKKEIVEAYKESFYMFLTSFSSNLYMAAIPVIIGVVMGPVYVAYYKVADNIKSISLSLMSPIYNVIYTKFNTLLVSDDEKANNLLRKGFFYSLLIAFFGASIIFLFSKLIILIIANESFMPADALLKIVPFIIVLSVFNQFFGVQTLVSIGLSKDFSKIICIAGVSSLVIIYPLINNYGVIGGSISALLSELMVGLFLYMLHRKKKIYILIKNKE